MNVGISIFCTPDAHIWSSGIHQNVGLLVDALRSVTWVEKVFLVNGGDADALPENLRFAGIDAPLVRPEDVTHEVDVVIEMGAKLPVAWLRRVEALGAKLVWFVVGHAYANVTEPPIFGLKGMTPFNDAPVHEVWYLPQHAKTCAALLETVTRAPAYEVPWVWSPRFLQPEIERCEAAHGKKFGFQHVASAWNVAILEPNISVVKSCFIPMLVCESAYRARPSSINLMRVMNSFHMKEHLTFNQFASQLNLTRDGRSSFEPRVSFPEAMLVFDVHGVVSHQWECDLNYAYNDALYGGYPLIHNSERLRSEGVGLFYPGFSADQGGAALLNAQLQDAAYWAEYADRAKRFLERLSPNAERNASCFAARLQSGSARLV